MYVHMMTMIMFLRIICIILHSSHNVSVVYRTQVIDYYVSAHPAQRHIRSLWTLGECSSAGGWRSRTGGR